MDHCSLWGKVLPVLLLHLHASFWASSFDPIYDYAKLSETSILRPCKGEISCPRKETTKIHEDANVDSCHHIIYPSLAVPKLHKAYIYTDHIVSDNDLVSLMVSKRVFLGSNFFHKHDVFFTQIWVQETCSKIYTPFGVHDGNVDLCTLRGILFDSSQFLLRFAVKHGLPSQIGSLLRYITNKIYSRPSKWIILYVHHIWTSPIYPVLHSTKAPWLLCLSW